jgi:hypothetical protein
VGSFEVTACETDGPKTSPQARFQPEEFNSIHGVNQKTWVCNKQEIYFYMVPRCILGLKQLPKSWRGESAGPSWPHVARLHWLSAQAEKAPGSAESSMAASCIVGAVVDLQIDGVLKWCFNGCLMGISWD